MHLAAALGMPVVCFFGDSDARLLAPLGRALPLLQPASRDVRDVSVDEALRGFDALAGEIA